MEYKVKSLHVGGRKKVFKSGDIVTAKDFEPGTVDQLVKDGYLMVNKLETDDKSSEETDTKNTLFDQGGNNDNSEETETAAEDGEKSLAEILADKTYKDFNKDKLKALADKAGIAADLPSKATKSVIFDALKATM